MCDATKTFLRRVLTATSVVSLAAAATGLLAAQNAAGQREASARPGGLNETKKEQLLRAVAAAKLATVRQIVDREMLRIKNTVDSDFSSIPTWSHLLMENRLRAAKDKAERIAAIREHRDRMREIEQLTDAYAKAGQGRVADTLKMRYQRLDADERLAAEGAEDVEVVLPPVSEVQGAPPPRPAPR